MDSALRQKIYDYLSREGLRRTAQRDAIIEAAFGTKDHFTAESLLDRARRLEDSVSRATVYRTLPPLVASGLLREVDFGRDFKYYDPNFVDRPDHNHLVCTDCQKIFEFDDHHLAVLENCLSHRLGFIPTTKSVRIEARCEELLRTGHCLKRLDSNDA